MTAAGVLQTAVPVETKAVGIDGDTSELLVLKYIKDFGKPLYQRALMLPAALPLFATGLGALGLLGWRRKKKATAVAA